MTTTTKLMAGVLLAAMILLMGNCTTDASPMEGQVEPVPADSIMSVALQPASPLNENARQLILLRRNAYTVLYNPATRLPVWVAWRLTADHTDGPFSRDGLKFAEDKDVPVPRATNDDYRNSGYDRGHMCPSGDNKWSELAQVQSFLYTNCCPQVRSLNSGDWNELEKRCRQWAQQYGELYIVCGPLFLNRRHKTIGPHEVVVPEAFFKVILCMAGTPKAIGFVYRNEQCNNAMASYVNSVDDVERLTGLDFYTGLPDDVERKVEAVVSFHDWGIVR